MNIKQKMKQIKWNKKHTKVAGILLVVFLLVFGANTLFSNKIAMVDLPKVVASSQQVRALHIKNEAEINALSKWLDTAHREIDAEKMKAKKAELAREYKEIAQSREEKIKREYKAQIAEIDRNITQLIQKVAKSHGCKTVLLKSSVVMGGLDITDEVLKKLNPKD